MKTRAPSTCARWYRHFGRCVDTTKDRANFRMIIRRRPMCKQIHTQHSYNVLSILYLIRKEPAPGTNVKRPEKLQLKKSGAKTNPQLARDARKHIRTNTYSTTAGFPPTDPPVFLPSISQDRPMMTRNAMMDACAKQEKSSKLRLWLVPRYKPGTTKKTSNGTTVVVLLL